VEVVASRLRDAGAVVQNCHVDSLEQGLLAAYVLQCAEASSSLARYDGVRYGYRNKEARDVLSMYCKTRADGLSEETKKRVLAGTYFLSVEGYEQYYKKAARLRTLVAKGLTEALIEHDCLLTPVHAGRSADDPLQRYWPACVNLAGLPALTFPGDLVEGLPVGVQLVGKAYTEPLLFALAEKAKVDIDWNRVLGDGQQSGGDVR
jgi:aspartyl-tRNA(Asn)/glutamyl-tRNA(Gln) amidotransferase subunit A